ncbi:c-type cytochrome [Motiliproteus sediminis]|uniref:c-type cytochrome n=1 Tax=Motiliproteus sediminis TaxID=1468178 RepID=UPI001AEFEE93|nr:cytochrome c [Motiliproteus sediminis]
MKKVAKVVCGMALLGMVSAPVVAAGDDPMEKAVKARQGEMKVRAFNIGILAAMAKGKVEYDADAAATAAKNLHLASMMKNGAMWPKGSDNTNASLKTEALPAIWQADSKVGEKAKAFAMAAEELAGVAGNGLDAMKPKFAALGKSCKGCHEDYREKKK